MNYANFIQKSEEYGNTVHKIVLKRLRYEDQFLSKYNSDLFDISKSLKYRSRSIIFHAQSIRQHLDRTNHILQTDLNEKLRNKDFPKFHPLSRDTTEVLSFLLDDQIFSSASYFDYLAKLLALYFTDDYKRWDWKFLLKQIKNEAVTVRPALKNAILIQNEKIIKPLSEHRSNIIHNRQDESEPQETFTFQESTFSRELSPTAPKFFADQFPDFIEKYSDKEPFLIDASDWLLETFFETINQILDEFTKAIEDEF